LDLNLNVKHKSLERFVTENSTAVTSNSVLKLTQQKDTSAPKACGSHCYWVCAVCDVTLRRQIHVSNTTF